MSGTGLAEAILLGVAAIVILLSSLGVFVMRGAYDKLHYLAPAGLVGGACIVAAVLVDKGLSQDGTKAIVVFAILSLSNPFLTFATGRMIHHRHARGNTPEPRP